MTVVYDSIRAIYLEPGENRMSEVVYKIEDLVRITGLTRRTIRYYIQEGLLDRPEGERRGAHYLASHLETLLRIRRLSAEGLSLEAIKKRLQKGVEKGTEGILLPKPGTSRTCVHITIAEGIELTVDPMAANINSEDLRVLVRRLSSVIGSDESQDASEH